MSAETPARIRFFRPRPRLGKLSEYMIVCGKEESVAASLGGPLLPLHPPTPSRPGVRRPRARPRTPWLPLGAESPCELDDVPVSAVFDRTVAAPLRQVEDGNPEENGDDGDSVTTEGSDGDKDSVIAVRAEAARPAAADWRHVVKVKSGPVVATAPAGRKPSYAKKPTSRKLPRLEVMAPTHADRVFPLRMPQSEKKAVQL
jgi:hypothetical protein